MQDVRAVPLRAVRAAAAAAVALAVRLVPVQRRGVRGLRVVHVLREGAVLPLRERRGGGRRAVRLRPAAGVRGRAVGGAAVPVAVLAAARLRGGGPGAVRALPPLRLPLPRASAAALQYYLVPPRAARALRSASPRARRAASRARLRCTNIYWRAECFGPRGGGLSDRCAWSECAVRDAGPLDERLASPSESSTSTL